MWTGRISQWNWLTDISLFAARRKENGIVGRICILFNGVYLVLRRSFRRGETWNFSEKKEGCPKYGIEQEQKENGGVFDGTGFNEISGRAAARAYAQL